MALSEITEHSHVLTLAHCAGTKALKKDNEASDEKIRKLTEKTDIQMAQGAELDVLIWEKLEEIRYEF